MMIELQMNEKERKENQKQQQQSLIATMNE